MKLSHDVNKKYGDPVQHNPFYEDNLGSKETQKAQTGSNIAKIIE